MKGCGPGKWVPCVDIYDVIIVEDVFGSVKLRIGRGLVKWGVTFRVSGLQQAAGIHQQAGARAFIPRGWSHLGFTFSLSISMVIYGKFFEKGFISVSEF